MALVSCKECGKEISDQAAACPSCGAPVAKGAAQPAVPTPVGQRKVGCGTVIVVLLVLGAIFVAILMVMNPEDPAVREERWRKKDAIELCWKEYERKSLDPATKRFVASACEKMEKDFRDKYGQEP